MYGNQKKIPSNFGSVFKFTTKVLVCIRYIFIFLNCEKIAHA